MKNKKKLSLSKVYSYIESGPVVLITSSLKGRPNVMPISWHTMLDFDPPLVGCVFGGQSYTSKIIKKTKEFAINIPTVKLAEKVVNCGRTTGKKIDKFAEFDLKTSPASKISAPLLSECYVNLECKVVDMSMVKKYELFVAKVVAAWIRSSKRPPKTLHHASGRNFIVGGRTIIV